MGFWTAWWLLTAASVLASAGCFASKSTRAQAMLRHGLCLLAALASLAAAACALVARAQGMESQVPAPLAIASSILYALGFGVLFVELVFALASKSLRRSTAVAGGLRGGLWIGFLERLAIAASLWAHWPEGIAVVFAIKGLGRFSELKNHAAAEQFIIGTFASGLVAAASYGLGLVLL